MKKIIIGMAIVLGFGITIEGIRVGAQGTTSASTAKTSGQGTSGGSGSGASGGTTKGTRGGATSKSQGSSSSVSTLKDQKEKASYALGMNIGGNLHRQANDELDTNAFMQGLKDALAGGKTLLTEDEMRATLDAYQKEMTAKQQEKAKTAGEANLKEGAAFLAANQSKQGVVALPSGLQYKILVQGTGPKPTLTDQVVCNYKGTLLNGKEFDSSYKRGQPATFGVNQVIKGWTEALQLMPVGSKWELFIPSGLAYQERAAGPDITPNSTLIFEVELISIKPKQ